MSKFGDIDGGRLIYTCNCGWVDLGHANPVRTTRPHIGAVTLWEEIRSETGEPSEYDDGFLVIYTQDMRKWFFGAGETGSYFVKYGLDLNTKRSIALTIFQEVSMNFETMQGKFPFSIFRDSADSSFSQEDLVSNVIGFYRAVYPDVDFLALCKPVSKEASKKVWQMVGSVGSKKNRTFTPVFLPCEQCKSRPVFPKELQEIKAAVKETNSDPPKKGVPFRNWQFAYDRKSAFDKLVEQGARHAY